MTQILISCASTSIVLSTIFLIIVKLFTKKLILEKERALKSLETACLYIYEIDKYVSNLQNIVINQSTGEEPKGNPEHAYKIYQQVRVIVHHKIKKIPTLFMAGE